MKLELKHIAPYLPYGLKYADIYVSKYGLTKPSVSDIVPSNITKFIDDYTTGKPILRPLSDLTKEIEVNGERFVPKYKIPIELDENLDFETCSSAEGGFQNIDSFEIYECYQKLFEWHFDVFGLIENGIAIDINTLNK